ncbi:MAG: SCO family protein [Wenzhouxiangellaceae bacterium]
MSSKRGFLTKLFNASTWWLIDHPQVRDVQLDGDGEFIDMQLNKRVGDPLRMDDKLTRNKLVLVNFFSSRSEEQNQTMRNLAEVARRLDKKIGRDVFINSVTMDPDYDTVERLEAYAKELEAPTGWTFVRATGDASQALVGRMGRVRGYTSVREIFYGTPNGFWGTFPANNTPEEVAHRLSNTIPQAKPKKLERAGPVRLGQEKHSWTSRMS